MHEHARYLSRVDHRYTGPQWDRPVVRHRDHAQPVGEPLVEPEREPKRIPEQQAELQPERVAVREAIQESVNFAEHESKHEAHSKPIIERHVVRARTVLQDLQGVQAVW